MTKARVVIVLSNKRADEQQASKSCGKVSIKQRKLSLKSEKQKQSAPVMTTHSKCCSQDSMYVLCTSQGNLVFECRLSLLSGSRFSFLFPALFEAVLPPRQAATSWQARLAQLTAVFHKRLLTEVARDSYDNLKRKPFSIKAQLVKISSSLFAWISFEIGDQYCQHFRFTLLINDLKSQCF